MCVTSSVLDLGSGDWEQALVSFSNLAVPFLIWDHLNVDLRKDLSLYSPSSSGKGQGPWRYEGLGGKRQREG